MPCSEVGSIKLRCLKPTKQFPSSICAVYWLFYRQCKQPLRCLHKNRPVVSQAALQLEAGDAAAPCCVFCVQYPAQLCHFFLSSRNTISDLTSSLWSAKLHVFVCVGQNDSSSQNLLEIFLLKQLHSSCTKNINFKRCHAVSGYTSSVWTSTPKFPIRLTALCRASVQILAWGWNSMIWLQLAYLAPNSTTISIKKDLAPFDVCWGKNSL